MSAVLGMNSSVLIEKSLLYTMSCTRNENLEPPGGGYEYSTGTVTFLAISILGLKRKLSYYQWSYDSLYVHDWGRGAPGKELAMRGGTFGYSPYRSV